ncbi:hypothetical protein XENOCAPTIV_028616 [Xenoophorus captivus]|uniref:G-protein coupled receptors family 1 profile domain-containing protein n=1 Tax=Xenoophorus captivus TaxID=1517983 RepID=A0ABV0QPG7_9TELE
MSDNLSFSNNDDFGPYECYFTSPDKFIFITFNITQVVVLFPLCIAILYLGFQQLQQSRSTSLAVKISHSDSFTYHMVIVELIGVLGCIVSLIGNCMENPDIVNTGVNIFWFIWYGQMSFHTLTCAERYLAVVHPITYLGLRNGKGVKIRNISIGCVWLLCFAGVGLLAAESYIYLDISLLISTTITIFFFSISVLCVLIRPGPGEQDKERSDQSKRRAFYVIVVILGILMLRVTASLAWAFLDVSGHSAQCIMMIGCVWISLPSGLVLPLLYLQRAGKLVFCKDSFKGGTP